jgi:hypothetical protein
MTSDRELIQKLYKIAVNQQKIINKLAQKEFPSMPHYAPTPSVKSNEVVANEIDATLAVMPGAEGFMTNKAITSFDKTTGILNVDINVPTGKMKQFTTVVKPQLTQTLRAESFDGVKVTGVNVTGMEFKP